MECFGDKNASKQNKDPSLELTDKVTNGSVVNMEEARQQETAKTCQNAKWGTILLDYTQETSFHGPKQIAEPQPFILRRLIWLLLFLGGMVIFLVQVAISIQYYLSWPVSVDVKINYNESIIFPAVTICNSNAFRTTRSYETGYYFLISDLFGADKHVDINKYNASHLSLKDLYRISGHSMTDMIVSCKWNGQSCSEDDFTMLMTDYGQCYTFNNGQNKKPLKRAYQTGADGGLKLQLNIEQYEYMRGPNDGAGLKILIHNHNDVPMVRDHGLAVPPGSHGFVAIKTVEVNNLEPHHGKCNDSVKLDHFEEYTMSACYTDCKEKYLMSKCGCKDIYMPTTDGHPDVCSIDAYQTCMVAAIEHFSHLKHLCECPIPCHRLLYEPTVSYASASNFDIDTLLRNNNNSEELRERYVAAREITERVNEAIAAENTKLINRLNDTVEKLQRAFADISAEIISVASTLENSYKELQHRIKFHLDRGLEGEEYIVEHDFVRGWNVFKERAFHYVSLDFIGLPMTLKRTILNAGDMMDLQDINNRRLVFLPVLDMFLSRMELLDRAEVFINKTNVAYTTGRYLQKFRLTWNRRYDLAYIHVPLLRIASERQEEYYSELLEAIGIMRDGLKVLREVGDYFVETGEFNNTHWEHGDDRFYTGGKQYNYRVFTFESRIVLAPLEEIRKRLTTFQVANRSLHEGMQRTESHMVKTKALLDAMVNGTWLNIVSISNLSSMYLTDFNMSKTDLSMAVTSTLLEESVRMASTFFDDIRLQTSTLQNVLSDLKVNYVSVWTMMLSEDSVQKVYEMIYNDCQDFLEDEEKYGYYIKIFSYMLRIKPEAQLRELTKEEIVTRMNGDFHILNLTNVIDDIDEDFDRMQSFLHIGKHIGDADESFLESFRSYKETMVTFQDENNIDSRFYRENFMTLDVFMQELSYEEITQQKAYDIAQLLSDIGGSMGLFIGGSVLSVFEFLDIFIHHGMRVALNR